MQCLTSLLLEIWIETDYLTNMKRTNITPQQNAQSIKFNHKIGQRHMILREPSVVDEFYFEKCQPSDHKDESVSIVDPIIILFNQQRLDNMGQMAAKTFIDSLVPKSNSMAELRKNCSDDDLMYMIKSRHLQSPAEILSWCRFMKENIDTFNSEVQKLVESRQAEQAQKAEQVQADLPKTE